MAIRNIKEIINTKGYVINPDDRKIFEEKDLQSFFGFSDNDAIEFIIYDVNDNQLPQRNGELVRYITLSNQNINDYFLIADGTLFQKYKLPNEYFIDVERLLKEAGYANGIFKTQTTLINKRVGSEKQFDKLWIQEISPSRTEVRVFPLKDGVILNPELQLRYNIFVNGGDFREDTIATAFSFIEKIDATKITSILETKYTKEWLDELISEFKIKSIEELATMIYNKFIESSIYEFTNRISKLNDINYGKPKNTKPTIELSKKEIVDICKNILIQIIDYYLPQQDIKLSTTTSNDFVPSIDDSARILQRFETDTIIPSKTLDNKPAINSIPAITVKSVVKNTDIKLEMDIKKELNYGQIPKIITPQNEPDYIPIKTEIIVDSNIVTTTGGGAGPGTQIEINDDLNIPIGRSRAFQTANKERVAIQ
jgi:hypothetical protein